MKRRNRSAKGARQDLVIGRNAVRETLRHAARRVRRVLLAADPASDGLDSFVQLAERAHIPIETLPPEQLSELAGSTSHQAVAAELHGREFTSLKELLLKLKSEPRAIILALDSIQDPQNFGALLRSAECFGVAGVLWSKNRGVPLTPAVTKVSVGASELVPLVQVSNLAGALESCKQAGFWTVVAAVGPESTSLDAYEWPEKAVLILGAEGGGARDRTVREADFKVRIDMSGVIDSLNVSQAGAVLLHACRMHQTSQNN